MEKKFKFILSRAYNSLINENEFDEQKALQNIKMRKFQGRNKRRIFYIISIAAIFIVSISSLIFVLSQPETYIDDTKVRLILSSGETYSVENENANLMPFDKVLQSITKQADRKVSDKSGQLSKNDSKQSVNIYAEEEVVYNTLVVPVGKDYKLKLTDGTIVYLNSKSTFKFPDNFGKTERRVFIEGEAYFEVQKDTKPFYVVADTKEIRVLGTKFNVTSYPDEEWMTSLLEGKIMISTEDTVVYVNPNQRCVHTSDKRLFVEEADVKESISWISGVMDFKNYSLERIISKLHKWYDFKIIYKDESLKDLKFRGTIDKSKSLMEILESLEKTTDIDFEENDDIITVGRQ